MPYRVVIAESETLFSDLLGDYLDRSLGSVANIRVRTVKELRAISSDEFDLAFVDLFLADSPAAPWLRSHMTQQPRSRVVVVTGTTADYPLFQALTSGAPGVVHKTDGLACLHMSVQTVIAGGSYCSPRIHEIRASFAQDPLFFSKVLSPREQEVLIRLGQGEDVDKIASRLGVSAATCVDHRKTIMRKLGLHRQSELVAYALAKGFRS